MKVVKRNGLDIRFISEPCKEVQMEACRQNGIAIEHILRSYKEVQAMVYGEVTRIRRNEDVCNRCGNYDCKLFRGKYVRNRCEYLIEHGIMS